jgi:hypothetical protein
MRGCKTVLKTLQQSGTDLLDVSGRQCLLGTRQWGGWVHSSQTAALHLDRNHLHIIQVDGIRHCGQPAPAAVDEGEQSLLFHHNA